MRASRPDRPQVATPAQIYEHLSRHVIGQDRAKRTVALAAYTHWRRTDAKRRGFAGVLRKSNVLMIGPTGSGKTLIAQHVAKVLNAPFVCADATEYTEAGYYGKDVELMITDLLLAADRSVEEAERGVVFIDEIDKIARRTQGGFGSAGARDIGGEGVQQALLKMLEGREVNVPAAGGQPWSRSEQVRVDTTNILFICAGTFGDLLTDKVDHPPMGFGNSTPKLRNRERVRPQDLISYGMLAEFVGRLPITVELEELSAHDLLRVLKEPQDSLLQEARDRLTLDSIELVVRDAALKEIVAHAIDRHVGARGLRAVFEDVLSDVMFEAPQNSGRKVVVDAAYVRRRLRDAEPERSRP